MNREEIKKMLPIIQAYVDGKVVEYQDADADWQAVSDCEFFIGIGDKPHHYRIKPNVPKYRPFKDADECWNEMIKHEPFGWVKGKDNEYIKTQIVKVGNTGIQFSNTIYYYPYISEKYTFADGTPFGIEEGGEE